MAEGRPEIDVLIRMVSSAMEPITLDEVKGRAQRNDSHSGPRFGEQVAVNGNPPLSAEEVTELARHGDRAGHRAIRRPSRVVRVGAALALVAGIAVVGVVAGQREADRISSTGPAFGLSEADSTTTSNAAGTVGSTTVLAPVEGPPTVVTLETDIAVLVLFALDDGRLAVAGEGDTMQFWDPAFPESGPAEVRLEDAFGAGGQSRSVTGIGQLPSRGLVVASSFAESVTVEEIDPESGFGLRGGQLTQNVAPQAKVTMLRSTELAVGGTEGIVTIEEVGEGGARFSTGHTGTVLAVVELPDGRIVSGGSEGTVRIWDRTTGVEDEQSPVPVGHSGAVTALTVLADGRVASGDGDGAIRIWDPAEPEGAPAVLSGHVGAVTDLVELSEGRLASSGVDGTVRVWDLLEPSRGSEVLDGHTDAVTDLVVLLDGRLASGSSDTTVRIWTVGGSATSASGSATPSGSGIEIPPPGASADPAADSGTGGGSVDVDIPVLIADRAPTVIECESGPPDFPPNDGESDLEPTAFPTPEEALDVVLASIPHGGSGWKHELVRIDTPDGSINYAAPSEIVLPVGSQPVEEALFLVVVRPSGSGEGYVAIRWEMVGC